MVADENLSRNYLGLHSNSMICFGIIAPGLPALAKLEGCTELRNRHARVCCSPFALLKFTGGSGTPHVCTPSNQSTAVLLVLTRAVAAEYEDKRLALLDKLFCHGRGKG